MATTDEYWVTGPALITAKALRALRPGDRVQVWIGSDTEENVVKPFSTIIGTITEIDPPDKYKPDHLPIRVRRDGARISMWRNEDKIVAWQPQRPEKT